MCRRRPITRPLLCALLLTGLLCGMGAWAQDASTAGVASAARGEDPFAAVHSDLNAAVDRLLSDPAEVQRTGGAAWSPEFLPQPGSFSLTANGSGRPAASIAASWVRVEQLRPLLEPILREEGVPANVAAVMLVESGGRTTALSNKGALGLWQLMPATARRYGLSVTAGKDERTDAVKSTRAAARYFHDLYAQFGDWQLAFAAYNAGEQAVARAIERVGSRDFLRLSVVLRLETRGYVPAIYAALGQFGTAAPTNSSSSQRRQARVLYAETQQEH